MRLNESGAYLYCEYCSSLQFMSETDEDVAVGKHLSGEQCPVCNVELLAATVEQFDVAYCARCRGLLLAAPVFRGIIEARRADGVAQPVPRRAITESTRALNCPSCATEMARHPYYGPGDAVVDSCGDCFLLWLDHPELTVIVQAHQRGD